MPRVKPYKICIVVRQKSNLVKMFVINWTTSTPPFSLRDSRASKIRACVKITPCEKGDTRQREREK